MTHERRVITACPGDSLRFVTEYAAAQRPMFWLETASDGSIYLGPRYTNVDFLRSVSKEVVGKSATLDFEEGDLIDEAAHLKSKVSFHASGAVNFAGKRAWTYSLRDLTEQVQLAWVVFAHPAVFTPVKSLRKRDVFLRYPFVEDRPLQGFLYVAPLGRGRDVLVKEAHYQVSFVIPLRQLQSIQDLELRLIFAHGPTGSWQRATHIFWVGSETNFNVERADSRSSGS